MTNNAKTHNLTQKALIVLSCASFFSLALGTAPITICSLAALAVWIFSGVCYRDRKKWLGQSWVLPLLMLIVLPWLGMLWSSSPEHKLAFAERSYYWLFAFIAASAIRSEQAIRRVDLLYCRYIQYCSTLFRYCLTCIS
jgi:amino acid transporter